MRRLLLKPPVVLPILLLCALAIGITSRAIHAYEASKEESPAQSKPLPGNAATTGDNSSGEPVVAGLIDQAINHSAHNSARVGVFVMSLRDNRVIYARNADKLFTPASNMKVYTTAVALDLLGAGYRWRTSVYTYALPDSNGIVAGDLTFYGRGAPDLSSRPKKDETPPLAQLADDLYQRGVRHVRGNVMGDESYFRAEPLGDGWQWNDIQWYFGAEPTALSINDNEVDISIEPSPSGTDPPTVKLSNAQDYVHLVSNIALVKHGQPMTIGIHRGLSDNEVRVWGEFPQGSRGFGARLSVHDPALWAAKLLIAALKARGIAIDGHAERRNFRVPESERFDPARATELAYVSSKPLGEIVKATNKESINLNAELILRTLGRERGDTAPDPDPHKAHERGDDEAGLAVLRQWLSRAGISTNGLALHDGSGLSRLDLVTPEVTTRLLAAISKTIVGSVFQESLPIAGVDGTLKGRLRRYQDRVSAKTGSLTYDNSLSGFVGTRDGETLVFSVMCNDQTGRTGSIVMIDSIAAILADYSSQKPGNP